MAPDGNACASPDHLSWRLVRGPPCRRRPERRVVLGDPTRMTDDLPKLPREPRPELEWPAEDFEQARQAPAHEEVTDWPAEPDLPAEPAQVTEPEHVAEPDVAGRARAAGRA